MNNVGQQDGEETLSELHDREVRSFEATLAHQEATSTNIMAYASRSFAMAAIYRAVVRILHIATAIGSVAAIRELIKWW